MRVFAHRGFSHKFPEGTRAAYQGAVDSGADGFECDVRLTRDKEIICFHDRTTERIAGKRGAISRMSTEEIKALTNAITLNELLDLSIENSKDILIETKHPVLTGGAIERRVMGLLHLRAAEISASKINISLMSFSYLATLRMKRKYPHVMKVVKYPFAVFIRPTRDVAIDIELLRKHPGILNRLSTSRIYVWTVNSREDLRWLKKRTIEGVITDRPKRARKIALSSQHE